jgi:hypothetical protein
MASVKVKTGKTLYRLTMGPKEAKAVMAVVGRVVTGNSGDPGQCTNDVYLALEAAGVEAAAYNVTLRDDSPDYVALRLSEHI